MRILTKAESEPLEKQLAEFSKKKKLNYSPEDDIFEFCNELGFEVWKIPLDDEKLDGIILAKGVDRRIGLKKSLDLQDARFVLAHELSHYIREVMSNSPHEVLVAERDRIFHGIDKDPIEDEMDYMAAALLVPQHLFISDLKQLNIKWGSFKDKETEDVRQALGPGIIAYLAQKYCVNEEVVLRRVLEVSYYD